MKKDISNETIFIKDLGLLEYGKQGKTTRHFLIECKLCGDRRKVQAGRYNLGKIGMCKECAFVEKLTSHGDTGKRLYSIWHGIKKRCYNIQDTDYNDYGKKGISMCDEWKNNYVIFREWSIANGYDDSLSIDRIDTNGNYEPSNCRWADYNTQAANRKISVRNTSGYCGVVFSKQYNKWIARIGWKNKIIHLGTFNTPIEGALAYNKYIEDNNLPHTKNKVEL